ncbi:uncharacterized protein A1O5_09041 [Cladophialophora psammophila CBS 110553]|uniref:C3H1-type domain-containing protein n=1 Tax=Cladophialophora psammophila CBS 110553 TaxID=1182543 RepID=W9WRQ8_9EURO|nr:uncharacterized protein A1O5_09041 [Cladophialophora psammophila CBS 110553]EXJ67695.1 hypothetical protein A1O5_09041 [Cladophialophora psammophila CBS 110553]
MPAANPRNKLYTCRYWALGPGCPNTDAFGWLTCEFAHCDTGRLASSVQQRGTCLPWKHFGYCGSGVGCWYEHRETGVTGLYQGTVELAGFELEVADAATEAGFNTFNHEALFDLIWAVKRLALQAGSCHFQRTRPPKDPIYPDRYRPSGIGDNERMKRGAVTIEPPENHSVELKFHPVQPLMRKRPPNDRKQENLIDLTLSSDNETNPTDSSNAIFKRQKMVGGSDNPTAVDHRLRASTALRGRSASFTSVLRFSKRPSRAAHKPANKGAQAAAAIPVMLKAPLAAEDEISKQLLLVKAKLDDARNSMNTCQGTMKALFDAHYERFDNDQMMLALKNLRSSMNQVHDGGKEGAEEVDKAIVLLGVKKDCIL